MIANCKIIETSALALFLQVRVDIDIDIDIDIDVDVDEICSDQLCSGKSTASGGTT